MELLTLGLAAVAAASVSLAFVFNTRASSAARRAAEAERRNAELDAALRNEEIDAAQQKERLAGVQKTLGERDAALAKAQQDLNASALKCNAAESALAALRAAREQEQKAFEDRMNDLRELRKQMEDSFAKLSKDALGENSQNFLKLAQENLSRLNQQNVGDLETRRVAVEELVKPLKDTLGKVGEKVEAFDRNRAESFTKMDERIQALARQQASLQHETSALGEALRKPNVRGAWGEMQLRRVVEFAGMVDHCHFDEQVALNAEDRPDMIVHLPNDREIVVDAKAPMQAYLEALRTDDAARREQLLKDHVRQIRERAKLLGQKKYTEKLDHAPDFTVLFLPAESLYSTALSLDPELLAYGMQSRVLIATPTTLIALLMAVSNGWQDRKLADNAAQLKTECAELYERVCKFLEFYRKVGSGLENAIGAYNSSMDSMQSRLLPKIRKINDLGGFDKDGEKLAKNERGEIETTSARKLNAPEIETTGNASE
jgi:DNA recombination protein RmuC